MKICFIFTISVTYELNFTTGYTIMTHVYTLLHKFNLSYFANNVVCDLFLDIFKWYLINNYLTNCC